MDIGEGMALFRWRTINLDKYIVRECREQMMGWWPMLAEWPPEKRRRFVRRVSLLVSIPEPDPTTRELIETLFRRGYSAEAAAEQLRQLYNR